MTDAFADRERVKFYDVAVYFSEDEWERLEELEKELYRNAMEEIHAAILSLGYKIVNKKLLFRIDPDAEPHCKTRPGLKERDPTTGSPIPVPDILLRIKEVEIPKDLPNREDVAAAGDSLYADPKKSLRIKEEEHPHPIDLPNVKECLHRPLKGALDASPDLIVVIKTEEEPCGRSLPVLEPETGGPLTPRCPNPFGRSNASKSLPQTSAPHQAPSQEDFKQRKRLLMSTSSPIEKSPNCPRRGMRLMANAPASKRLRLERPIRPRITALETENSPKMEEMATVTGSQQSSQRLQRHAEIKDIEQSPQRLQRHADIKDVEQPPQRLQRDAEIKDREPSPQHLQRHAEIKANEIDILEIERNEKKTRQQTNWAVNVFKSWLKEQFKPETFEDLSKGDLALVLREFYATVRTTDSQQYSVSSYVCMRAGINRHINDPPYSRNFNIMRDSEFNSANNVFLATLKKLKKEGKDAVESHPAISPIDMQKLKNSKVLNSSTPEGLIRTVWFNIQIHFARRGRKGQRELPANAFKIMTDPQGFKYATLAFDEKTKSLAEPREYRGIMYASGHKEQCPVAALEKYLCKLPPNPSSFYLKAKRIPAYLLDSTPIWYENRPLGKNTLGGMMSALSREASLGRIYTNHSIRATSIQILSDAGLETREIMTLTGHKKDSSVRAYWAPTETQRKTWSHLLTLAGTTAENSDKPSTSGGAGNELHLASFVHCHILGAI